ncbi:unnamed protein product [Phytomonas sp. Hart1]|nr:unnamed protein product [Phytomonas sp. Hart1]|eukprot:CCW68249.1 unnamed protein product [Phytomonas sp. isolate Hart1]
MHGRVEGKLSKLGIKLPTPAASVANYLPFVISGGQVHFSGQLPKGEDTNLVVGQLGAGLSLEEGQKAARLCGINLVSQIKASLGDLDRVKKVVKINCFVNSSSEFTGQPAVANGCSDVLVDIFGEEVGKHARCAVGVAQLPLGAAVEVDAIVEFN